MWDEFLNGRSEPEAPQAIMRFLEEWKTWGSSNTALSTHEHVMTMGPMKSTTTFSRATINDLKLRTKQLDQGKKSCNSFFSVEYQGNGTRHRDIGQAEYFFKHTPPGHLMVEERRLVPFVKARWFWWPEPRKSKAGLELLTTIEVNNSNSHCFISPIWHACNISDVGVSLAPVDDHHHVPRNIRLGGRTVCKGELRVVIESTRRITQDVESIDIPDVLRRL